MDVFIEDELKLKFTKSKQRRSNLVYRKLTHQIKKEQDRKKKRKLVKQRLKVYSKDVYGPSFRRLYYVRYIYDWVTLVAGPFKEAKVICDQVFDKLKSLGLTLNLEKTHITLLKDDKCRFLGMDFFIRKNDDKHHKPTTLVKKVTLELNKDLLLGSYFMPLFSS